MYLCRRLNASVIFNEVCGIARAYMWGQAAWTCYVLPLGGGGKRSLGWEMSLRDRLCGGELTPKEFISSLWVFDEDKVLPESRKDGKPEKAIKVTILKTTRENKSDKSNIVAKRKAIDWQWLWRFGAVVTNRKKMDEIRLPLENDWTLPKKRTVFFKR